MCAYIYAGVYIVIINDSVMYLHLRAAHVRVRVLSQPIASLVRFPHAAAPAYSFEPVAACLVCTYATVCLLCFLSMCLPKVLLQIKYMLVLSEK